MTAAATSINAVQCHAQQVSSQLAVARDAKAGQHNSDSRRSGKSKDMGGWWSACSGVAARNGTRMNEIAADSAERRRSTRHQVATDSQTHRQTDGQWQRVTVTTCSLLLRWCAVEMVHTPIDERISASIQVSSSQQGGHWAGRQQSAD